jgi:hypothetical protein
LILENAHHLPNTLLIARNHDPRRLEEVWIVLAEERNHNRLSDIILDQDVYGGYRQVVHHADCLPNPDA